MLTQLTRGLVGRTIGLGVSVFAMLGFLAVPLGERTGFQHAKAIVLSDEASHLGKALRRAIAELERHLRLELSTPPSEPRANQQPKDGAPDTLRLPAPARPALARPASMSSHGAPSRESGPVPWCSEGHAD